MRSAASWCDLNSYNLISCRPILSAILACAILVTAAMAQAPSANNPTPPPAANASSTSQQPATQQPANQQPPIQELPAQPPPGQGDSSQPQPSVQEPQPDSSQNPQPDAGSGDQSGMFVFKKQVQEVVLHATVTDEQRNLVPGLDRNAFTVFENGAPQTITSFRREDVPVAIGIVVDNSSSMRDKREKISQAVLNLIRVSNPQDEVFVVNFTDNPYLDQDFTSDVNLLQVALRHTSTRGSTALYDAVAASSSHLYKSAHLDKKVLLVITDGQDNMSRDTLQEAARRLQQPNGPTLYAVGLLGSGLERRGREALQRLAEGTGGVAYFPDTLDQVDTLTKTIARDIRSQYMIAYKPKNQNARPEYQSVRLEAHAPGYGKLTVRTKSGYYPPQATH